MKCCPFARLLMPSLALFLMLCAMLLTRGQFWQAMQDKLPTGQDNDWPHQGIASSPVVDGNRLYYVNNRCEVICAGAEGKDGEVDIIWRLDMIKDLAVNPRFLAICSPLIIGDF